MSLLEIVLPNGPSGYGYGSTAEQVTEGISLQGKTMLVTGCNSGLGEETLRVLVRRGAQVIGTARTLEKAQAACGAVGGKTIPVACELSDPASVRACVKTVQQAGAHLDAVICNAGIMALPKLELQHGYEAQFFTNHIGHFILVTGLLEQLAAKGRVVMLSSAAHTTAPRGGIDFDNLSGEKGYSQWATYGRSKFANVLFAKGLAKRFAGSGRTANAVHPGVIRTNLGRHMNPVLRGVFGLMGPLVLKSVAQGAATQVFVATHPSLETTSGEYFADCNIAKSRADTHDVALAQRLWDVSEQIVAKL
jgi:WW domain-containing oxidoreductase